MTVLVCEDEEIMLTALAFRLRKFGYDIERAHDGREAIEKFDAVHPDIVITDIMMPHVSGLEVVRHIRETRGSEVPIVIISALEMDEVIVEALRIGANDFIVKPFRPVELVLRVRLLSQHIEETTKEA